MIFKSELHPGLESRESLQVGYERWLREAYDGFPLREAAVNFEVPGDQFLAATALVYDLTLVTMDHRLTEAPWLPTLTA